LGSEKGKSLTLTGFVSNIDTLPMGRSYSSLVGDVSVQEYQIYSEIFDKSDKDYYNYVNNYNRKQDSLLLGRNLKSYQDKRLGYYNPYNDPNFPSKRRKI
jgi:hypothetical protein